METEQQASEHVTPSANRTGHSVPVAYGVLFVCLLGFNVLLYERDRLIGECTQVLLSDDIETVDDVFDGLAHAGARRGPVIVTPDSPQHRSRRLDLPWFSALNIWIEYEPESQKVVNADLLYCYSDTVDLITRENAGYKPAAAETFYLGLAGLVCIPLWYAAARLRRLLRIPARLPLVLVLIFMALLVLGAAIHILFLLPRIH